MVLREGVFRFFLPLIIMVRRNKTKRFMKCRRCAEGGLDLQGRAGGTVVGHSKRYLVSYCLLSLKNPVQGKRLCCDNERTYYVIFFIFYIIYGYIENDSKRSPHDEYDRSFFFHPTS